MQIDTIRVQFFPYRHFFCKQIADGKSQSLYPVHQLAISWRFYISKLLMLIWDFSLSNIIWFDLKDLISILFVFSKWLLKQRKADTDKGKESSFICHQIYISISIHLQPVTYTKAPLPEHKMASQISWHIRAICQKILISQYTRLSLYVVCMELLLSIPTNITTHLEHTTPKAGQLNTNVQGGWPVTIIRYY